MPLNSDATNQMTCTSCGWSRILDPVRAYRGGHTNPETGAECHGMIHYEQLSPLPPEVSILGEKRPKAPMLEITTLASDALDAKNREKAKVEKDRNDKLDERLRAEVFELEGEDIREVKVHG